MKPTIYFILILALCLIACQEQPDIAPTATSPAATSAAIATEPPPTDMPPTATVAPITEVETVAETADSLDSSATSQLPLIDNFEINTLPSGQADLAPVGFLTWSDGSAVAIQTVQLTADSEQALPEQTAANSVMHLDTTIGPGSWAGFTHAFSNATADTWEAQDWSASAGIAFWLYGNNTGGTIFMDILDNRAPDSRADDAERWSYDIVDDFSGWQYFEIPFDDFRRKDIGNGAPNDGFTLTAVHGYAIGTFGSVDMGAQSVYIDDVQLYGVAPIRPTEIKFVEANYIVRENGRTTILVNLTKPSEETVTVDYGVAFSIARPVDDYEPINGTLTFPPGETVQSFDFKAVDDDQLEDLERLVITLSNPTNAELAFLHRTVVAIRDNEEPDPSLITDFSIAPPFITSGMITLTTGVVMADNPMALPDQTSPMEGMLSVEYEGPTTFGQRFAEAHNWSEQNGLSFWFYGQNIGQTYTVELLNNSTTTTADLPSEAWQLVWSDEFNGLAGAARDSKIWWPEIGDGTLNGIPGWGNNEWETYTNSRDNSALDGEGNLALTARQIAGENSDLVCWYGPCEYSSARLITWHRLEVQYGRIEARMKLPYGQGIWPAFWMLGTNIDEVSWPQSGEIDIMEHIGREPNMVHGTVHGPGYSGANGIGEGYELPSGNFADDFHTFAVEWTPAGLSWLVDGESYFTLTPDEIPPGSEWVYDHPFFIILNLAVGGNWPGYPNDTTTFPQTLLVDYVRVYGAPSSAERYTATFEDSFSGWQLVQLPFADFTRSANQPAGAPDDGLDLGDIWGYQFVMPANSSGTLYFDQLRFE